MNPLHLHGKSLIVRRKVGQGSTFRAARPISEAKLDGEFHYASQGGVDAASRAEAKAFEFCRAPWPSERGVFMERIAQENLANGDTVIKRAHMETGLPQQRSSGERMRIVNQLRLFAENIREGSWVDPRIDHAQFDRKLLPKPDVCRLLQHGITASFPQSWLASELKDNNPLDIMRLVNGRLTRESHRA